MTSSSTESPNPRPPKVSVLMLTYNHAAYIDDAICSVLRQRCPFGYELLIADDHSTDGTSERCQAWADRFPDRIRYIRNPRNKGLARNFMDSYALLRGEYVAICEGDDWWISRHKLRRQIGWLDRHPDYALCYHRVVNFYPETGTKSLSNGGRFGKRDVTLLDLAAHCSVTNVSSVWRRGLFGPLPEWFDRVPTYDYALHLLNLEHGKGHFMRRPMAVYRQHGGAIWSTAGEEKSTQIACGIRRLLIGHFAARGNAPVCDRLLAVYLAGTARLLSRYRAQLPAPEAEAKLRALREELDALPYPEAGERERRLRAAEEALARQTAAPPSPAARLSRLLSHMRATLSRCIPLPRPRL